MAITRSQRSLEVRNRCARAVNYLSYVANAGGFPGAYRYRVGMLAPEQRELLIWLISFIVISATREEPPEGEWADREAEALRELFDDLWMENLTPLLPPIFLDLLNRFRAGSRTRGGVGLIRACEERTSPQDVLLRVGFQVVDGERRFRMVGRGRVVEDVVPAAPAELVFEPVSQAPSPSSTVASSESSSGDCPQFDSDGHMIESSVENSPETETEDGEEGENGEPGGEAAEPDTEDDEGGPEGGPDEVGS